MATPAGVRQLYRAFLREGVRFPNYNMREYIKRRARDGFRENAALSDASAVEAAWGEGKEQLGVVRRQSVVYGLYARKQKTVMEVQ